MHSRKDGNVDKFEREGEARAGDGGFQPGHLLVAWDQDATDALGEGLLDGPNVAVTVEDGEAEGLEDGAAPGDGGGGLRGGEDGVVEAEELEGEDCDEEEGGGEGDVEGFGGEEGGMVRTGGWGGGWIGAYGACGDEDA